MADDLLTVLSAAAFTLPNATSSATLTGEVPAVQVGSTNYIIAILAINISLLISMIVATLVSKFWSQLPIFDYTDLACISAGKQLMPLKSQFKDIVLSEVLEQWNRDPTDRVLGQLGAYVDFAADSKQLSVSLK
ncbi:hypothetical protein MMC30_005476 [Trapelia coarctata]|nr:hypothetical protein [Trapelia coarctata]